MRRATPARRSVVAAMLAAAALGAGACSEDEPPTRPGVVKLGALYPLTGRASPSGLAMMAAAKLAVSEVNAAGGVLGRRVELVAHDDACDPGTAVTQANALVAKGVEVSVGGYCSSAAVPTLAIFHGAGVPMVIASSNSTDLLAAGYRDVFLVSGTTTDEARFALRSIQQVGGRRLSVVSDGTSYSQTLAEASGHPSALDGTGVTVVGQSVLSQGAPSYRRVAEQIIASGPDTVYYTGYYAEAAQLIIDLRAVGYAGKIFLGDGCIDDDLIRRLSPAQFDGVYGTALKVPAFVTGITDWVDRFRAANGAEPGPNTLEAYDAARIALDAIKRAGSLDRAKIRDAIAATSGLRLLTGPVAFNPDGSRVDAGFLLLGIRDGRFELVT